MPHPLVDGRIAGAPKEEIPVGMPISLARSAFITDDGTHESHTRYRTTDGIQECKTLGDLLADSIGDYNPPSLESDYEDDMVGDLISEPGGDSHQLERTMKRRVMKTNLKLVRRKTKITTYQKHPNHKRSRR